MFYAQQTVKSQYYGVGEIVTLRDDAPDDHKIVVAFPCDKADGTQSGEMLVMFASNGRYQAANADPKMDIFPFDPREDAEPNPEWEYPSKLATLLCGRKYSAARDRAIWAAVWVSFGFGAGAVLL